MFKTSAENHDYNTRNALNFEYPNNKLNFLATRVLNLGITYQIMLKVVKNLNSFKTSFKQLIISDHSKII